MKILHIKTPIGQMTGEQFLELIEEHINHFESPAIRERKCVYGIQGIAKIFGCSIFTVNRIKASGKIDGAITRIGRKIVVDVELDLIVAGVKNRLKR